MANVSSGKDIITKDHILTPKGGTVKDLTSKSVKVAADAYKTLGNQIMVIKEKLSKLDLTTEARAELEVALKPLLEEARALVAKGTAGATLLKAHDAAETYFAARLEALLDELRLAMSLETIDINVIAVLGGTLTFILEVYSAGTKAVQATVDSTQATLEEALLMVNVATSAVDAGVDARNAIAETQTSLLIPVLVIGGLGLGAYFMLRPKKGR